MSATMDEETGDAISGKIGKAIDEWRAKVPENDLQKRYFQGVIGGLEMAQFIADTIGCDA